MIQTNKRCKNLAQKRPLFLEMFGKVRDKSVSLPKWHFMQPFRILPLIKHELLRNCIKTSSVTLNYKFLWVRFVKISIFQLIFANLLVVVIFDTLIK